jgi:hypothetical protein
MSFNTSSGLGSFNFTGGYNAPRPAAPFTIQTQQQQQQPLQQLMQPPPPQTHPFESIRSSYDPNSPSFPFRAFFYNRIPQNTPPVSDIIKPPQVSDRLWQQVLDDNPKPGHYIPVMATGFTDLEEREKWQSASLKAHLDKLAELEARLEKMLGGQDSNNKVVTAIQRQNRLASRVISIMRKVEVLRRAGRKLSDNEQEMLKLLTELHKKLATPPIDPTSVRVFAFQIKALKEEGVEKDSTVLSEQFVSNIVSLLSEQQMVLKDLVETINSALVDYDIMIHGYLK